MKATATPVTEHPSAGPVLHAGKQGNAPFFGPAAGNETPFFAPRIQTKLTIGKPGDKYEQEADAVADRVVQRLANPGATIAVQKKCQDCAEKEKLQRKEEEWEEPPVMRQVEDEQEDAPVQAKAEKEEEEPRVMRQTENEQEEAPPVQTKEKEEEEKPGIMRQAGPEEEEPLQAKAEAGASSTPSLQSRLSAAKGTGAQMDKSARAPMEAAFGQDFGQVRIHTDSGATQMNCELNARAFTHGRDIYFNAGEYSPGSTEGKRLLAHELVHVGQQGGGTEKVQMKILINVKTKRLLWHLRNKANPTEDEIRETEQYKAYLRMTGNPALALTSCKQYHWHLFNKIFLGKSEMERLHIYLHKAQHWTEWYKKQEEKQKGIIVKNRKLEEREQNEYQKRGSIERERKDRSAVDIFITKHIREILDRGSIYVDETGSTLYKTKDRLTEVIVIPDGKRTIFEKQLREINAENKLDCPKTNKERLHVLGFDPYKWREFYLKGNRNYNVGFVIGYNDGYYNKTRLWFRITMYLGCHSKECAEIRVGHFMGKRTGKNHRKSGKMNIFGIVYSQLKGNKPIIVL